MYRKHFVLVVFAMTLVLPGCVSSAPDTTGFAIIDSKIVDASFDEAWQATKASLRENDYVIYTRDIRGRFVAWTEPKRRSLFVPVRTKLSILLEPVSGESTKISVETVREEYGVTLLTYPGWHERKTEDNSGALALLEDIESRVGVEEVARFMDGKSLTYSAL